MTDEQAVAMEDRAGGQLTDADSAMAEGTVEELGPTEDPAMSDWLEQRRRKTSARWPYP